MILRDGNTVYELNELGTNKWTFTVNTGRTDSGARLPNSICGQVTMRARISMVCHDQLVSIAEKYAMRGDDDAMDAIENLEKLLQSENLCV